MAYTPTNWTNFPSTATPVNASNLNKIENELVALDTGKADATDLDDKVDKVEGYGLSENDFDNTYKDKLDGISEQANKVEITPVVTEGTTLATISIDGVNTDIKGSDIDVDDEMSPTSENPLQNKIIYETLQNILPEETAEGNPISITDASGLSAKSCEVAFSPIQSGTGDPSPENIRPISGRDSLVLNQCGKNLFDISSSNNAIRGLSIPQGTVLYGITTYTSTTRVYIGFADGTQTNWDLTTTKSSYTAGKNIASIAFGTITWDNIKSAGKNVMVSLVDFDTYEPYQGTTHTATFPSTVYGGEYEFVEGVLKKTFSSILDLGTRTWTKTTSGGHAFFYASVPGKKIGFNSKLICSQYKQYYDYYTGLGDCQISGNTAYDFVYIRDDSKANLTGAEFKTAMSGVHLCYELATPQEITLTAEQIELLKGNNTLWTDGDNITLKYSADIKAYIESQLNS